MKLEQLTIESFQAQNKEDQKRIAELKQQMLARKITMKVLQKQLDRKPFSVTKLGHAYHSAIRALTVLPLRLHGDSQHALEMPQDYEAVTLSSNACKLLKKCQKIASDHKKALKYCERAASMVMKLEDMSDKEGLFNGRKEELLEMSENLDQEVQRLRPTKSQEN